MKSLENTYWGGNGRYEELYNKIWDAHVPPRGSAKNLHGELLRVAAKFYHDYYNNGNCNVADAKTRWVEEPCGSCHGTGDTEWFDEDDREWVTDDCQDCGGNGFWEEEEECGHAVDVHYEGMMQMLEDAVGRSAERVRTFIESGAECDYEQHQVRIYERLIDDVCEYIQTHPDRLLNETNEPADGVVQ